MDNNTIKELTEKFLKSSNRLDDLIENLELLNSTLEKMDSNVDTMSEFKDLLIENNLLNDIQEIISKSEYQFSNISQNMKEIQSYVSKYDEVKNSFMVGVEETIDNFSSIKNTIEDFNKDISPSIKEMRSYLMKLNSHNYSEIARNLLNKLENVERTVNYENKIITDKLSIIDRKQAGAIEELKSNFNNYINKMNASNDLLNKQNIQLNEKLSNVMNTYNVVSNVILNMEDKNEKAIEKFFELCDSWAQININKLALKNKKNNSRKSNYKK